MLVAGRAIQGAGGAVFPLAFGIIRDEFPRERVATGIGLISATFGIGGGAGLVLAGLIVDHLDYTWIFWLALVIDRRRDGRHAPVRARVAGQEPGARSTGPAPRCCRRGADAAPRRRSARANAWGWGSRARARPVRRPAVVLLAVWVRFERRTPEPLVDMRMMRQRGVWTTNLTTLLVGFGMFGSSC